MNELLKLPLKISSNEVLKEKLLQLIGGNGYNIKTTYFDDYLYYNILDDGGSGFIVNETKRIVVRTLDLLHNNIFVCHIHNYIDIQTNTVTFFTLNKI
jgi:hypothetical protein